MNKPVLVAAIICLFLYQAPVYAGITLESFSFEDKTSELDFREFLGKVRCLVCQNQSLADSDAGLAHDLRTEIYEMYQAGKSKDEISTFLVDRYGDFVLYDPPIKPKTWLIWLGPFALLLVAGLLLTRSLRRQAALPIQEITDEDRKRLDARLGSKSNTQDKTP